VLMGFEPTTSDVTDQYSNQAELQHQISNMSKNQHTLKQKTRLTFACRVFLIKKGVCNIVLPD
jgi:hypothetical protein